MQNQPNTCTISIAGNRLTLAHYSFSPLGKKTPDRDPNYPKNDTKLERNLNRAKQEITKIALSNPWQAFCTLTFRDDSQHDYYRMSFHDLYKLASKFTTSYSRKNPDFAYLLVPEHGELKNRLHLHGFLRGIPSKDLRKKKDTKGTGTFFDKYGNPVRSFIPWNKSFGISELKMINLPESFHQQASISHYITKYVTKDILDITLGTHSYVCSNGLDHGKSFPAFTCDQDAFNDLQAVLLSRTNGYPYLCPSRPDSEFPTTHFSVTFDSHDQLLKALLILSDCVENSSLSELLLCERPDAAL